jgi:DNA-binding transcriptional ArsR family regulator
MLLQSELERSLETYAALLSNMANCHRLHVLMILKEGEASVSSMLSKLRLSQSALSQHLARLRDGKLVATRREGQAIYYSCKSPTVFRLLDLLTDIHRAPAAIIGGSEAQSLPRDTLFQAATKAGAATRDLGVIDEIDDQSSASEADTVRQIEEDG